jgi:DNA-binding transcriptional ArsR family regulator
MQHSITQTDQQQEREAAQSVYRLLKAELERRRAAIIDEIRHYPPPIPACDVQYNGLLEERTLITQELKQLERLGLVITSTDNARQQLDAFMRSSRFIDQQSVQTILSQAHRETS